MVHVVKSMSCVIEMGELTGTKYIVDYGNDRESDDCAGRPLCVFIPDGYFTRGA